MLDRGREIKGKYTMNIYIFIHIIHENNGETESGNGDERAVPEMVSPTNDNKLSYLRSKDTFIY